MQGTGSEAMSRTISVGSGVLKQTGELGISKEKDGAVDSSVAGCSSRQANDNDAGRLESLVDPQWELIDPTPDIRALFLQFNDVFFEGKLVGCEVTWSPRMTLCAGLCRYEGRGGLCSIRLSKPLLILRPRRDLVETLLHEMIHAYLFVTVRNRDRDGHGAEFQLHMNRINARAGTRITVYHSFHAEVAKYQQHWWRCEGPCRNRRPFYGFVKRATNRAPGPYDHWWRDHQARCGGKFVKVKEPEGYENGKNKKANVKRKAGPMKGEENTKRNSPSKTKQTEITKFFTGTGHVLGEGKPNESSSTMGTNMNPVLAAALRRQQLASTAVSTSTCTVPASAPQRNDRGGCLDGANDGILGSKQSRTVGESSYSDTCATAKREVRDVVQGPSTSIFDVDDVVEMVHCPVCTELVLESDINSHLDDCLS
ncbi:unnamed protein product [Toxocara canis]|uniref:Protein with SprT-like domain at the N terminus n=1 Tax=Toxocara canis TaxID=6265 RepID=A0A3P7H3D7_TOXCA|nr:unnamed protein product [Toxocara canis]